MIRKHMKNSKTIESSSPQLTLGFNRWILALALMGFLLALHIWVMEARSFDRGCLGVELPEDVEALFDCKGVADSDITFFGIPNVYMGMLYYLGLLGLSFLFLLLKDSLRWLVRLGQNIMITIGMGYSIYLYYLQHYVLEKHCALCMTSTLFVTLLFIGMLFTLWRSPRFLNRSIPGSPPTGELFRVAAPVLLVVVLAMADIVYFIQLAPAAEAQEENLVKLERPEETAPSTGGSEPEYTPEPEKKPESEADPVVEAEPVTDCYYRDDIEPYPDYASLISPADPILGNPEASVMIFDFFDPNCVHCKKLHGTVKELMPDYEQVIQVIYKPFPLWVFSVDQIQALVAAQLEGKYFNMLDAQFDNRKPGKGLSLEEIGDLAAGIGMDKDRLIREMKQNKYRNQVLAQRHQIKNLGVNSAPTLMINGKFIASKSRTVECLRQFIESEL